MYNLSVTLQPLPLSIWPVYQTCHFDSAARMPGAARSRSLSGGGGCWKAILDSSEQGEKARIWMVCSKRFNGQSQISELLDCQYVKIYTHGWSNQYIYIHMYSHMAYQTNISLPIWSYGLSIVILCMLFLGRISWPSPFIQGTCALFSSQIVSPGWSRCLICGEHTYVLYVYPILYVSICIPYILRISTSYPI